MSRPVLATSETWNWIVHSCMMLGFCVGYDRGTRHRACSGAWGRSCPFYRSTQVAARPPPCRPAPQSCAHLRPHHEHV